MKQAKNLIFHSVFFFSIILSIIIFSNFNEENSIKDKPKKLNDLSKEELVKIVKNLDIQLTNAIKMVASLRYVLKYELRTPQGYWDNYVDIIAEEEFDDPLPPEAKELPEPRMKSKKKQLEGYQ